MTQANPIRAVPAPAGQTVWLTLAILGLAVEYFIAGGVAPDSPHAGARFVHQALAVIAIALCALSIVGILQQLRWVVGLLLVAHVAVAGIFLFAPVLALAATGDLWNVLSSLRPGGYLRLGLGLGSLGFAGVQIRRAIVHAAATT